MRCAASYLFTELMLTSPRVDPFMRPASTNSRRRYRRATLERRSGGIARFTMIELVIVILIMSIFAAVAAPKFS